MAAGLLMLWDHPWWPFAALVAGGVYIDAAGREQDDPLLPAETTTTIPAALRLLTAASMMAKLDGLHPSIRGHPQLLLIASGASSGLGFSPFRSVGARKNSKHST